MSFGNPSMKTLACPVWRTRRKRPVTRNRPEIRKIQSIFQKGMIFAGKIFRRLVSMAIFIVVAISSTIMFYWVFCVCLPQGCRAVTGFSRKPVDEGFVLPVNAKSESSCEDVLFVRAWGWCKNCVVQCAVYVFDELIPVAAHEQDWRVGPAGKRFLHDPARRDGTRVFLVS